MRRLLIYYSFVVVAVVTMIGFAGAENSWQLLSAIMFYPVALYLVLQIVPQKRKALVIPKKVATNKKKTPKVKAEPVKLELVEDGRDSKKRYDKERRAFIKLIGSAGVTVFLFSMFTKKAQAAFFGSVPGPGSVSIKDSSGTVVDPAIKQPTDGYKITQLDETSDTPNSYYGFVDKDGAWFIMKDDGSGNYRYVRASSDFTNASTGWPNRTALSYGYFDSVF